jgi:von Willebrand factor A domain-containing protein 8
LIISLDDYFVIILSDANLNRYGIHPNEISELLNSDPRVHAAIVFIGTLGEEAKRLTKALPSGKSYVAFNASEVPRIMKQLFTIAASS